MDMPQRGDSKVALENQSLSASKEVEASSVAAARQVHVKLS